MTKKTEHETTEKKFESRYNPKMLRECINAGMHADEIMAKLEIKHRQTFKQHILKLMNDDKYLYEVKGLYLKGSNCYRVNKKLELKIYLEKVDLQGMHIEYGDEFRVSVEDERIILTKA
ncbi:hypothetical protein G3N56_16290 [Desulfovibrio sulfodismutans]|uniref:Uncharacterized protein n=1 Tax=Desulfolutivibrio sulfodismutans TaxID=63561 RepID=A0A7K3NR53_9BACT|nr:hypothetical protein [Desulfolutivibrio sulfodismutans]NDY58293.1 hypothetical protein [Desulfolutivibrio sulfodismutans]QLA12636.1 hypothetical protein GD606_10310 [Desulfolutivibrio sulfodismutans DSM 3696]